MAEKQSKWKIFTAGILRENRVLRLGLGLNPGVTELVLREY